MFPFLIRQTIFGPKGIENTGKMEMTEIQRYKIALERLKQLSDIRLGKPLLIQTLMGNLRVLHSNHIGYFKYISTKKSWEIALTDGSFVRLKENLRAKNLCAYNDRFIQIHQSYIINIQYLCMIQNNHCIMYPPFHHINELCISQKYKRELTAISTNSEADNPAHNVISFNHFSQNPRYFPLKFVYSTKRNYFVKITKIHYMKKHILLLGIFLSLTVFLSVQAGNTVIDSLKQEIRQAEREPSSKEKLIELYQFLGAEYETLDHDSSYHYIQKGLSLYPQPAFEEEGYLQLLNSLANYLFMEGKLEQAKETFKTVAAHAPKLKERRYDLEGVVESSIGVCYRKLGMFDSAVYHYNRALDFCKKTEKYEDIASTYYNIGVLYHLNKRYEEALEQGS